MPRCFSCGSSVVGFRFTCPACEGIGLIKEIDANVRHVAAIEERGLAQLSDSLSRVSEDLSNISDTISGVSDEIANLASVMEWGFEEIKWELRQQTDVLKSIDHTLKNPSQVQADEWRRVAEQLRERACPKEAAEWFLKALAQNPLDYRTYIGLAMIYLHKGAFDKAADLLTRSLPHAPKDNAFDYRSLSYRLIGRTFACREDWVNATSSLRSAIELSPKYAEGDYDYAQYCLQAGSKLDWIPPLCRAIMAKPVYWYMARAERNFAPAGEELPKLLLGLHKKAQQNATEAIARAERKLHAASHSIRGLSAPPQSYNDAERKLESLKAGMASKDYRKLLFVCNKVSEVIVAAEQARAQAERERKHTSKQNVRESVTLECATNNQNRSAALAGVRSKVRPALGYTFLGWFLFGTGGCMMRFNESPGLTGVLHRLAAFGSEGILGGMLVLLACIVWAVVDYQRTLGGK